MAQNLALNKPMLVSSQGGSMSYHPPGAANDGTLDTNFYTRDSPWSFAAVDLQDTYEVASISLTVHPGLRKSRL